MANMELEGMSNLIQKLEELGSMGKRIENKALKKAGNIVLEEAKRNVPVKTGKLKESLKVSGIKSKKGQKYILTGIQKDDNNKAFWGKFVEYGTSKMSAKPFLAPAFESKKNEAKEIIKQEIKMALNLK